MICVSMSLLTLLFVLYEHLTFHFGELVYRAIHLLDLFTRRPIFLVFLDRPGMNNSKNNITHYEEFFLKNFNMEELKVWLVYNNSISMK